MGIFWCDCSRFRGGGGAGYARKLIAAFYATSVKALATVDMLKLAYKLGFSHLTIESNCLVVISNVNSDSIDFSVYGSVVEEILSLCASFSFISFRYVHCLVNGVSHCLAYWSLGENFDTQFDSNYPNIIHGLVLDDIVDCLKK